MVILDTLYKQQSRLSTALLNHEYLKKGIINIKEEITKFKCCDNKFLHKYEE